MTRKQLIDLALSEYPGAEDDTGGDTLAVFIKRELVETYEPDCNANTQLQIAAHVLERAIEDLQSAMAPISHELAMQVKEAA